jgi:hypothetical protein
VDDRSVLIALPGELDAIAALAAEDDFPEVLLLDPVRDGEPNRVLVDMEWAKAKRSVGSRRER